MTLVVTGRQVYKVGPDSAADQSLVALSGVRQIRVREDDPVETIAGVIAEWTTRHEEQHGILLNAFVPFLRASRPDRHVHP